MDITVTRGEKSWRFPGEQMEKLLKCFGYVKDQLDFIDEPQEEGDGTVRISVEYEEIDDEVFSDCIEYIVAHKLDPPIVHKIVSSDVRDHYKSDIDIKFFEKYDDKVDMILKLKYCSVYLQIYSLISFSNFMIGRPFKMVPMTVESVRSMMKKYNIKEQYTAWTQEEYKKKFEFLNKRDTYIKDTTHHHSDNT